jgi:hypothetical protein
LAILRLLLKYQVCWPIITMKHIAERASITVNALIYSGASSVRKTWAPAMLPQLAAMIIMLKFKVSDYVSYSIYNYLKV